MNKNHYSNVFAILQWINSANIFKSNNKPFFLNKRNLSINIFHQMKNLREIIVSDIQLYDKGYLSDILLLESFIVLFSFFFIVV